MTGITIITAGRKDAYQDYLQSVNEGHDPSEFEAYLPEHRIDTLTDPNTENIHLWGSTVDSKWRAVSPGDIALVYRDGRYIAQATVVGKDDNLELAEHLWRTGGNPWDPENPWRYLTFLSDVEEIEVDMESFNQLVGYKGEYIPQGFTRVSDTRIESLEDQFESVETAVNELTGTGVRVHEVDPDETEETEGEVEESDLGKQLVELGVSGDRAEELEEMVAIAFSRLGFDSRWIEGGDDTDIEITDPITAIVEVKARSRGKLASPDATRILGHKDRYGADHAIVVAPGFTPAAIDDADRQNIVLLSTDHLQTLLEHREKYALIPEILVPHLTEPGAFQDDRVDQIEDSIRGRLNGARDLISVVEALQRADTEEGTATNLRLILKGMYPDDQVPSIQVIEQSLNLLAHPSIRIAEYDDGQYQPLTSAENARILLERLGKIIQKVGHPDEE